MLVQVFIKNALVYEGASRIDSYFVAMEAETRASHALKIDKENGLSKILILFDALLWK